MAGTALGSAIAAAALRWTRIDHAAIWNAQLAMQGWFGAVLGTVASVVVAMVVLRATIQDEHDRAGRQVSEERDRLLEQLRHERELVAEGRRADAWSKLLGTLPDIVEQQEPSIALVEAVERSFEAFLVWTMHLGDEHSDMLGLVRDGFFVIQRSAHAVSFDREAIVRVCNTFSVGGVLWHQSHGDRTDNKRRDILAQMREKIPHMPILGQGSST